MYDWNTRPRHGWTYTGGDDLSIARKFAGDVGVRLGFQILNVLKGLVFLPLIARLFGATGYSIWAQIFLTITLLSPLITLRLNAGLVRYFGGLQTRTERSKMFFEASGVVWGLSLAVLAFGLLARNSVSFLLFADSDLMEFSLVFTFLLVARVNFAFVSSYYRAISAIRTYTVIQTLQILLEIVALYGISLLGSGKLEDALLAFVFIDLSLVVVILADIVRREGLPKRLDRAFLGRLLRFSLPLIPAAAMYWIVNSSDRYVIIHLVGLDQAGVYSAAYRVAQILKLMLQPISFVLLPLVSTMWENKRVEQTRLYLSRSLFWFLLLAIPGTAGLISIGPALLITLGTADFAVGRGLIALLAIGELCVGIYQIYVYVIYLFERTWIQPLLFGVLACLNLGLNLVLVPRIGMLGAAATTCGAYLMQAVFVVIYTQHLLRIDVDWKALLKITLGGVAVLVTTWFVSGSGIARILLSIAVGMAAYAIVLVMTRAVHVSDLRQILGAAGGRRQS